MLHASSFSNEQHSVLCNKRAKGAVYDGFEHAGAPSFDRDTLVYTKEPSVRDTPLPTWYCRHVVASRVARTAVLI
eukprot:1160318-Pelagomonas_calceolata.AAC.1